MPHLRIAAVSGQPLSRSVYERFRAVFGIGVGSAYGLTETGIVATDLTGRHGPPVLGAPVPDLRWRLRDGELHVHTGVSPYLWEPPADRFADGWLRTRDRCELDPASGVLRYRGRSDSLAIVNGLNVDLVEVEGALETHPLVDEAVVVHDRAVEAYVGTRGEVTEAELTALCRARLSPHKVPRRFHITAALPRTSNGKLVRDPALLRASRVDASRRPAAGAPASGGGGR